MSGIMGFGEIPGSGSKRKFNPPGRPLVDHTYTWRFLWKNWICEGNSLHCPVYKNEQRPMIYSRNNTIFHTTFPGFVKFLELNAEKDSLPIGS